MYAVAKNKRSPSGVGVGIGADLEIDDDVSLGFKRFGRSFREFRK
jgi:hypothetical protein